MHATTHRWLAAGALGIAAAAMTPPGVSASEDAWTVVNDLDRCVQRRFAETDKRLGMVRMATTAHQRYEFAPEDESERDVILQFDARRIQVVMYLAGWQRPRVPAPWTLERQGRIPPLLQGPVFVHPRPSHRPPTRGAVVFAPAPTNPPAVRQLSNMPDQTKLEAEAVDSLLALSRDDSRSF